MELIGIVFIMVLFVAIIFALIAPIFWIITFINTLKVDKDKSRKKNEIEAKKIKNENNILKQRFVFVVLTVLGSLTLFIFNSYSTSAGVQQTFYQNDLNIFTSYKIMSETSSYIYAFIFVLGLACAGILSFYSEDLAPIPYVLANIMLMINIILGVVVITQLIGASSNNLGVFLFPAYELIGLFFMYFTVMASGMKRKKEELEEENKQYKNVIFNKIYILFIKIHTKPLFIFILAFPVMFVIQLILVLFGQSPDTFIKMFLDTSNYTYSMVPAPDPIIIYQDSHYLCTVSARGHKNLVKPLRSGIRSNKRILVNRQLLVANAFENILEEYTPKTHKFIRYIYDKYGYPLSKKINTKFSADITYIVMKPLEWMFLVVLYCIDKNPENRINIQYSELREGRKLEYK